VPGLGRACAPIHAPPEGFEPSRGDEMIELVASG